ncbi:MAG TPA: zinc ribbon domain-containing protein [candidate division Zixibacteria bacterium]|nr:zinc ribbon domain-containing protein [candidate division Zixibacteria bacterium]
MPLYEYRCRVCDERFEQLRPLRETGSGLKCPKCKSVAIERVLSTFATGGCGSSGSRFR